MSRKVAAPTPDQRAALPESLAWTHAVENDWGPCLQVLLVDREVCGWVVYAPTALVPGAEGCPTSPASPDAVLLAEIWVDEEHRNRGLGRMLLTGVLRDLTNRRVPALEAFGDTRDRTRVEGTITVLPLGWLEAVGFGILRPHSTTPRMRLDVRTAVSWKDGLSHALERLARAVRPAPMPAPERRRGISPAGRTAR